MIPNGVLVVRLLWLLLPITASSFIISPTKITPTIVTSSSFTSKRIIRSSNSRQFYIPFHFISFPQQSTFYHKSLYQGKHSSLLSSSSSSSETSSLSTATSATTINENNNNNKEKERRMLYPAVGDVVRYYDLDGGNPKGQMMIGKISYISKNIGNEQSGWTVEIIALDPIKSDTTTATTNTGGGLYYTDYPKYQTRQSKAVLRDLYDNVSPVACVFVNTENAYKVSIDKLTQQPIVRQEQYDLEGYEGPFVTNLPYSSNIRPINTNIVQDDAIRYDQLKMDLFQNTLAFGMVVSVFICLVSSSESMITNWNGKITSGYENALIYFSGVLANLLYLYFLSMKTDTMATTFTNNKFGKVITNLRFLTPIIPLIGVSIYNQLFHHDDFQSSTFKLVSTQQFFAVTLGFLSYRIPLFYTQIQESFKDDADKSSSSSTSSSATTSITYQPINTNKSLTSGTGTVTPGKVSLVSTMDATSNTAATATTDTKQSIMKPLFPIKFNTQTKQNELVTIFLISGPSATGRSELVQRFVQQSDGRFVSPNYIDRYNNATQFEYIDQRNGFIYKSNEDRYGFTRESLVQNLDPTKSVMILDTDVDFALQLSKMGGGIRLVAVWVTLGSIEAFEQRIGQQYDQQTKRITDIMPDEGRNIEIRARTMKIVQEIELGISSGIFEFTIINDNEEQSLKELRDASKYCFV